MKTKRVSIALIRDSKDDILFGIRNDSGKFTNPGGHLNEGEDPYCGMVRELKEETGLDAIDLKLCKVEYLSEKSTMIYVFEVKVDTSQQIDPRKDPDKEAAFWAYLDPNDIIEHLHVPLEDNVVLQYWAKS